MELGIDIGSLEACIIVGYPGTIASFWQQAGRAGRGDLPSLVFFVGLNAPIDQYLLKYQDYLFGKNPEAAVIDPGNPHILLGQLRAAAYEAPLTGRDLAAFGKFAPAVKGLLEEAGEVNPVKGKAYWQGHGFPAGQVNLRNISENTFTILDEESGRPLARWTRTAPTCNSIRKPFICTKGDLFRPPVGFRKKVAYTIGGVGLLHPVGERDQIRLAGRRCGRNGGWRRFSSARWK